MGRPRAFDTNKALDAALKVFWQKGYEGTALPDLTKAMGINRPSLYAAFGDKESLFRRVMEHYANGPASYFEKALALATARAVAERLLLGAAELLTDPRNPAGCLFVQGALACSKSAQPVQNALIARRANSQTAIQKRLQRAKREGDLPADANASDLARYLSTLIYGMAVQASGGATRKELERVAKAALLTWQG